MGKFRDFVPDLSKKYIFQIDGVFARMSALNVKMPDPLDETIFGWGELQQCRCFGDHISWYSLDDALVEAKSRSQPIMLVVHKTWCGACKALKPKFADSKEIAELSKSFIMVNLEDNEEPKGGDYAPDGGYIPRILFLNPDGEVQTDFYNQNGNSQYKYFYPDAESIATMMKKVASELSARPKPAVDEL